MIRDEVTIEGKGAYWQVYGFKPAEDQAFTDRGQDFEYAAGLGQKHFVPVVWGAVVLSEIISIA